MDESLKKLLPVYALVFLRALSLSITVTGPIMPLYVRSLGVSVSQWSFLATARASAIVRAGNARAIASSESIVLTGVPIMT